LRILATWCGHVLWVFLRKLLDNVKRGARRQVCPKQEHRPREGWPREVARRYACFGGSLGPMTCVHTTRLRITSQSRARMRASFRCATVAYPPSGEYLSRYSLRKSWGHPFLLTMRNLPGQPHSASTMPRLADRRHADSHRVGV
jgi:hypothetical protein